MALIGSIRTYSCRYVDKKRVVSVVIAKEKILSVPLTLRETNQVVNAVVAFVCPSQCKIIADTENAKSCSVVLETLQEYMINLRMPLIVLTGVSYCDTDKDKKTDDTNNHYELSYYHSPSVQYVQLSELPLLKDNELSDLFE